MPIKWWNGSAHVTKPLKVWNGSAWVQKTVKRWNGSAWVTVASPSGFTWGVTNHVNVFKNSPSGTSVQVNPTNFTPPNNSLLVVVIAAVTSASSSSAQRAAYGISGGGLTWTRQRNVDGLGTTTYGQALQVYTAPVTTGAAMAITATFGSVNSIQNISMQVFSLTGPTTFGIGALASQTPFHSTGAGSLTLSASPAATSIVLGFHLYADNGTNNPTVTPGSGWTEIYDQNAGAGYACLESQYKVNPGSTSVPWADLSDQNYNSPYTTAGAAIEITGA